MKKYLVSAITWGSVFGSMFADSAEIEANNKQEALKKFCEREGFKNYKIKYDSKRNSHQSNQYVVSIIEGHYGKNSYGFDVMYVTGRRGYYKILI